MLARLWLWNCRGCVRFTAFKSVKEFCSQLCSLGRCRDLPFRQARNETVHAVASVHNSSVISASVGFVEKCVSRHKLDLTWDDQRSRYIPIPIWRHVWVQTSEDDAIQGCAWKQACEFTAIKIRMKKTNYMSIKLSIYDAIIQDKWSSWILLSWDKTWAEFQIK